MFQLIILTETIPGVTGFEKFISSSVTGNIFGLISVLVGLVSLAITFITYRMTKKIEKKLPEAQAKAINVMRFKEYRPTAIKALEREKKIVRKEHVLSHQTAIKLVEICNNIMKHKTSLKPDDFKRIQELYKKIIVITDYENFDDGKGVIDFIEITTALIGILQKGEYDI